MRSPDGSHIELSMLFAIAAMLVLLLIHVPVNYQPLRKSTIYQISGLDTCSLPVNLTITSLFLFLTVFLAIALPDIVKVLSVLGGILSVTVSFTLPSYCYFILSDHGQKHWKTRGSLMIGIVVTCTGYFSVLRNAF